MAKWLILIGVILVICIAEWMREIFTFKVTHYNIRSEKLNGLTKEKTVVFLSDLHNNCYGKNNEKLVEAIQEQKPDLILVGGDMLVGEAHRSFYVAEELMRQIVSICPVYYANGNHEYRMKIDPQEYGPQYENYKKALVELGVHFLENEHVDLKWDNCPVRIYGLEIPRENYKKFKKVNLSVGQVKESVGVAESDLYGNLLEMGSGSCFVRSFAWWSCACSGIWRHHYAAVWSFTEIFRRTYDRRRKSRCCQQRSGNAYDKNTFLESGRTDCTAYARK